LEKRKIDIIFIMLLRDMKNDSRQYIKSKERERALEAGFYDGRFRHKVVEDKKKKRDKEACRSKEY
jgi:hypothetical protein